MLQISGIVSALVTPFDNEGALDLGALARNVRHQKAGGIRSFCPLGGTGEPISMTEDERYRAVDAVRAEIGGDGCMIVGCLLPSQREIVDLGRHARAAGADAIMVIPPYFVSAKPAHIRQHFADIAEKVDLPMVLFNGPTRAGIKLETDFVLQLAAEIPHFVAIKEATGDMNAVGKILRDARPGFAVLQGYEELLLPTLAMGGVGGVVSLACLIPRLLTRLQEAFERGDIATARKLQNSISQLGEPIYAEANPAPLKYAMNKAGLWGGSTRAPLYPISGATKDRLARILPSIMEEERRS